MAAGTRRANPTLVICTTDMRQHKSIQIRAISYIVPAQEKHLMTESLLRLFFKKMQFRTLDTERRDKRSVRKKVCGQAVVHRHCNTMEMDKENITDIEKFSREGLVCSSDFLQSIDIEIVPNDKNKRRTFTTFEGNIWEASCTH